MCTGLEPFIIPLLASAVSAGGAIITNNEQQANADAQAAARNQVVRQTMVKNDAIAQDSRNQFAARLNQVQPEATTTQQAQATTARGDTMFANMPDITPATMPGAADAPTIVKTAIAKALSDAMEQSRARTAEQANLGGFGDQFFNMGLSDADANRGIATDAGFVNANNGLIAPMSDAAAAGAYKPISPIGAIMQGVGSAAGSAAGAGTLTLPRRSMTTVIPQVSGFPG